MILAQVGTVAQAYDLDRILDGGTPRLNDPVLLLFPLVFTVIYSIICKNTLSSFLFGIFSWMVFPLAFLLIRRTPPSEGALIILFAMGVFYGLVGAISSVKMSEIKGLS